MNSDFPCACAQESLGNGRGRGLELDLLARSPESETVLGEGWMQCNAPGSKAWC